MWSVVRRWFRPEPQRCATVLEPGTHVGDLLNAIAASMPDDDDDWPDW